MHASLLSLVCGGLAQQTPHATTTHHSNLTPTMLKSVVQAKINIPLVVNKRRVCYYSFTGDTTGELSVLLITKPEMYCFRFLHLTGNYYKLM